MSSQGSQGENVGSKRVFVVGAGIIGTSVAYHLSELGQQCTVIEKCEIACAASGKSGGFLAKDWCDSSAVKHLARPSFEMHREFAASTPEDLGYRTLESYSISLVSKQSPTASRQREARSIAPQLSWVDGNATILSRGNRIGSERTNAQVHPRKLTHAFLDKAAAKCGSRVLYGRVEDVQRASDGHWELHVRQKSGENTVMQCDVFVLAMGPWSIDAKKWFQVLPAIMALKAASLVVKAEVPAVALFTQYVNARGELREPEAYPRRDEVYLCQSAVPEDLPDDPSTIGIHEKDDADLHEFARAISTTVSEAMGSSDNVIAQACNLPISPDGIPVIGVIPGTDGCGYIATGHSCWGILNSPATGKAIAEMIVLGKSTIDVAAFSPSRFV